jgi:EmrB/QacA subfamily drug resistance transporter
MDDQKTAPPDVAAGGVHPLVVASIVATAFFMESFDSTVIAMALPMMAKSFSTTPVALSIGLTSYILALAVVLPASGWIADRWGVRNVFCAAIILFTIASAMCGLSGSLPEFVMWRALQGCAGALMSPVGRLVVLRSVAKKDLVRAMNFVSTPGLVGPLVGPPIGGFIATYADWRWIFFINIPVGLLGVVLAWRFIPQVRDAARRSFDVLGFCLNGIGLVALLIGLDLIGHPDDNRWIGTALTAFGVVVGYIVVVHYRRTKHPLIDLSAVRIKTFAIATMLGGSLFRMAISAPTFVLPLFLQVGLGKSAFVSGLLVLAHSAGDLGMKVITTRTLQKLGFRTALIASAGIFGVLIASLALVDASTPVAILLAILLIAGAVRSLQMTALSSLQFADVPREKLTGASTLASLNQNVTRALGIAFSAIVLNTAIAFHSGAEKLATPMDFHIAFIATGLLSLAAMVRYFSLAADAGQQVRPQA